MTGYCNIISWGESGCTFADALTTRVSKACCDVRAAGSGFPCVSERCGSALYQSTDHFEVITHFVVEVATQTCQMKQNDFCSAFFPLWNYWLGCKILWKTILMEMDTEIIICQHTRGGSFEWGVSRNEDLHHRGQLHHHLYTHLSAYKDVEGWWFESSEIRCSGKGKNKNKT